MIALRRTVVLRERTYKACALASQGSRVVLAWTGTNGYLNTLTSRDGQSFGDKATLPFRSRQPEGDSTSPQAPAVAAGRDGFHLAWVTEDGRPVHHVVGSHGILDLGERTTCSPALAAWGDEMVLAYRGTDRHLNLIRGRDGVWGSPLRLEETSLGAPSLCISGDELVLAWAGRDRGVHLLRHRGGGEDIRVQLDIESPDDPPAICAWGGRLVVAWTEVNRRIALAVLERGGLGEPQPLDATSPSGPALCTHRESLVVAWRDMRNRVCVALAV